MSRPTSNALSRSWECIHLAPRLTRLGGARDAISKDRGTALGSYLRNSSLRLCACACRRWRWASSPAPRLLALSGRCKLSNRQALPVTWPSPKGDGSPSRDRSLGLAVLWVLPCDNHSSLAPRSDPSQLRYSQTGGMYGGHVVAVPRCPRCTQGLHR